jgi:hypothetical protein
METYILKENVLTDDLLYIAGENKVFRGGYIAKIKQYTFQNAWSDKETILKFRKLNSLHKYLKKHYPNFNFYN